MVISLLQPSTEVMELFDDLLLLAQGCGLVEHRCWG